MEKIQERGLRFVYSDAKSSYSELLSKSNKNMLYIERLKKISLFVYKCVNEIGPSSVHDLFSVKPLPYNMRDPYKVDQPKVKTTSFGLNSLKYSGANIWNKLPIDLKAQVDLNVFKRLLKTWDGPSCNCGVCTLCKIAR